MTKTDRRAVLAAIRKDRSVSEEWLVRYQAADPDAAEILLAAHAGLIRTIASRYRRPNHRDWDDCIQEGGIGLLRGAKDFKPGVSAPSTYLSFWIRHRIQRHLVNACQNVRIPSNRYVKKSGAEPAKESLARPRTRTFTEMAQPGADPHDTLEFEDTLVSLGDAPEDEMSIAEFDAACGYLAGWFLGRVGTAERRMVLLRRFSDHPETLKEIGDSRGQSREWIRLVEKAALEACRVAAARAGFPVDHTSSFEAWVCRAADVLGRTLARKEEAA